MANKATTATVKFRAVNKMTAGTRAAQRTTNSFFRSIRRGAKAAYTELRKIDSAMRGFTSRLPGIGMLSGAGVLFGGVSAVKSFAEFESMGTAIMFASDSAVEGKKNLTFLRQLSKDLAIDFRSASDGFKMFSASMMGSKFTSKDQREMFADISKGIRVMGLDAEKSESVFRALGEMVSKGQIMAQELKMQLGNALPGAVQHLASSMNITKKQLFEMMGRKGGIDPENVLKRFTEYLGNVYDPAVAASLNTTSAKLTKLSNAWLFMTNDIGEALSKSGVVDYITDIITKAGAWVKANKEMLMTSTQKGVHWIKEIGTYIVDNWSTISNVLKILTGLFVGLKVAIAALSIAAFVTNPVALAVAGILSLVGVISLAILESDKFTNKLREGKELLQWYETAAVGIGSFFDVGVGWKGLDGVIKRLASLGQVAISVYQAVADLMELVSGGLYDATGANISANKWSKSLDEWANPEVYGQKAAEAVKIRAQHFVRDEQENAMNPYNPYSDMLFNQPEKVTASGITSQEQPKIEVTINNKADNVEATVTTGGRAVNPMTGSVMNVLE